MCGIVGYVGGKAARPILLDCLKRLEYRGYDSAGVALHLTKGVKVTRSTGRLSGLEAKLLRLNGQSTSAQIGIGHTRWATHGRPSEQNAHPHSSPDGKIVVVHNGIFENFVELRQDLVKEGITPVSQTDTECLPLLIFLAMRQGESFDEAFHTAIGRVRGKYSIACLHADHPGKILLARSGPTLVVGIGKKEYFIASDVAPLLPHTRQVVFLEDGDTAVLSRQGLQITDRSRRSLARPAVHIDWDSEAAELNGHRHFMHKEILEQPTALNRTSEAHLSDNEVAFDVPRLEDAWPNIDRVVIAACGTSWHAGLVGKFLIERLARVPVEVDYASEYRYRSPIVSTRTLALAITQSGETADTLAATREAIARGARTLAICNAPGSQITRVAEGTLLTLAGPEIGVASTKAFTTQVAVLSLLALHLARVRGTLGPTTAQELVTALRVLPSQITQVCALESQIQELAWERRQATNALYIARGPLYPIALEGALKLKEISYIHAEGYPAGELKHGPIALIDEQMPVIALMPKDEHRESTLSNLQEAVARDGKVVALVTQGERALDGVAQSVLELPETHPCLAPILYAVPLQLFAYHLALLKGCDVDRPRNLAKSVTVE
ncbi:MAG TPA: glutamine--fructose-6-phosphate transaminase (isomerizing) [Polyangiaceae bacterium]|nr:glutamine--fructose-6-phosphate transaminase (isomerizing) [Polyangiaceae bacterium]